MANPTMTLISSYTSPSGGVANYTFSSIPATYTDLVMKMSVRDTVANAASNIKITFNGSATGYSERLLLGTGAAAASANQATTYMNYIYSDAGNNTASTFSNGEMYIPNYAGGAYKSLSVDSVTEDNSASNGTYAAMDAGLWSNTAAITSITLTATTLFAQYSTFYLYGIKNN